MSTPPFLATTQVNVFRDSYHATPRKTLTRAQALEARAPTTAQLAYLASLGDQAAPPGSLWDASQRIDALVRGKGKP